MSGSSSSATGRSRPTWPAGGRLGGRGCGGGCRSGGGRVAPGMGGGWASTVGGVDSRARRSRNHCGGPSSSRPVSDELPATRFSAGASGARRGGHRLGVGLVPGRAVPGRRTLPVRRPAIRRIVRIRPVGLPERRPRPARPRPAAARVARARSPAGARPRSETGSPTIRPCRWCRGPPAGSGCPPGSSPCGPEEPAFASSGRTSPSQSFPAAGRTRSRPTAERPRSQTGP